MGQRDWQVQGSYMTTLPARGRRTQKVRIMALLAQGLDNAVIAETKQ